MCGITVLLSLKDKLDNDEFKKATTLLRHRGPDDEGFYFSPDSRVALGHRRLSILDLSAVAHQPMFSSDGRYCIVFNGEIYNFKELRKELKGGGSLLKTESDTEVIIELFSEQGPICFSKFKGMFAFAIYDTQEKSITICRDQVGVKPLFYYQDEEKVIFSSELKSIKSIIGKNLQVNRKAIPSFLHLGFIPHPETIYNKTFKFPSAHYLQIDTSLNSLKSIDQDLLPFWKLEEKIESEVLKDKKIAKKRLNELLLHSVERNLISDVPVGVLLSGGIDSSLITAMAVKLSGKDKVNTFSIVIEDKQFDESIYARSVAKTLGTAHHEFRFQVKDVLELIDKMPSVYEEPLADPSIFPTMVVSKFAKEKVTVALGGDGADELFNGYTSYKWAKRLSNPVVDFLRKPLYNISTSLNSNKYNRIGNMFNYDNRQNIVSHIFSQSECFFSEKELGLLLVNEPTNFAGFNQSPEIERNFGAIEKQSFWDFNNYLKDDLLVKIDRASMFYSLECRVPFLDPELIEFSYNIDVNLKIHNGVMKYLLKQVLYDYLPPKLFDRPKQGFSIPIQKWLKTDLRYLVERYTSKEVIERYNLVHFGIVEKIKQQFDKGQDYLSNRLWLIIVMHWWLEESQIDSITY